MYTTVLFDIDGVMLSEERYFDASALTVHELLTSTSFLGLRSISPAFSPAPDDSVIGQIRKDVFQRDQVLERLKNVGVNANWDMVYFVFVAELDALLRQSVSDRAFAMQIASALTGGWTVEALQAIGDAARANGIEHIVRWDAYDTLYAGCHSRAELMDAAAKALSQHCSGGDPHDLWNIGQATFQEWYLGDGYTGKTTGKQGFLTSEYAIVPPDAFSELLTELKQKGIAMGVATGRPRIETHVPLTHFGWLQHFDLAHVTTASDVVEAEEQCPSARPLSKPHPFSYLRSLTGDHDVESLLACELPLFDMKDKVLIVGDSIADGLAAQRLGASFAAVLTGLEGEGARPKFERLGADYIFENVLGIKSLF
ncbi:haloacid dehalogenase [Alicyclobacillus hesperidum subsp. aegles]|uniref:HAD family hydrolase n=1 Tax=Alicyclobacillus hesperidum TaxID=89784 RepID=UPI0007193D73|nr:HAD hydrolase-like protein [Alicyclobacillus hesperidum]KRW92469.1 haloacid dehalogenase [Alicyclobacillus tengchongensis]GLG01173.1 haloacid dehalogenase [Alicyclobacillus hesperidum subsp. aegles]